MRRCGHKVALTVLLLAPSAFAQLADPDAAWTAAESAPERAPAAEPAAAAEPVAATPDRLNARLDDLISPGGLTADEAARLAARTSYDVAAADAALEAARARVSQAEVGFFPNLTLRGSYTRQSEVTEPEFGGSEGSIVVSPIPAEPGQATPIPPGTPLFAMEMFSFPAFNNFYDLRAGITVPLSDYVLRLSQSYAAATHSERAVEFERQASVLGAALNGRVAFYTWLRAQAHLVIAEENVGLAESLLTEMKVAFDVGTASTADVLRVKAEIASANLLLERARSKARVAEERLRVTLHKLEPGLPITIGEDPRHDPAPLDGMEDLERLRAEAMRSRLEVRALDETKWAFTEEADAARGSGWPRLELFANGVYANPNQRYFPQEDEFRFTWDAGAAITWSPNGAVVASAQAEAADARASQTEMQKSALRDAIRIEVTRAYQAFREARLGIETSELQRSAAAEAFKVRQQLFGRGRASGYDLTQDAHELTRARVNVVNARINLLIARAQLVHATGRDIAELPGLSKPAKQR